MEKLSKNRIRKIRTWTHAPNPAELTGLDSKNNKITLLDIASNDYLGLNKHPKLIQAAYEIMYSEGVGAGGSRLITGSRPIHRKLEIALSKWLDREEIFLFPSGFQANIAAVHALVDRYTPVLTDRLIHHSLLVGVKASGAKLYRYAHNDLDDLERQLKGLLSKRPDQSPLVITESLFSMEGTSPNINTIAKLCENHGAKLLVDEAHALGVIGPEGKGLCYGLSSPITIISGTFGKAFGSGGAFLACNKEIGEHLLQSSGAFRYTTALAPPLCASALAALDLIQNNPTWGQELQKRSIAWRQKLKAAGWEFPSGNGPIIPLLIGLDENALKLQHQLENNGLLTVAIRPPTVPEGKSRLRLVVRKNLPKGTLNKVLQALCQL
tara:strand:- start:27491 stop:28633 length:1143 start_codon:yes stop_codon:yes gene_type:complete